MHRLTPCLLMAGCVAPAPPDVTATVRQVAAEACAHYVDAGEPCNVDPWNIRVLWTGFMAAGMAPARDEIVINRDEWPRLSDERWRRIIAHEAAHCCRASTFGSRLAWWWWYIKHRDAEEAYASKWANEFMEAE